MKCLGQNELIKFTLVSFIVAEMCLPVYSCENSNQTYTQHQLMTLLYLMKRLRLKYREIVELIELIPELIGLKGVPHLKKKKKFFKTFRFPFLQ